MKTKMTTRKRRTKKSIKNSWFVLLIVLDNHGPKMPLIHKVSFYNYYLILGLTDVTLNLGELHSETWGINGQKIPLFHKVCFHDLCLLSFSDK